MDPSEMVTLINQYLEEELSRYVKIVIRLLYMRLAIAESYSGLNNYEQAELEYKILVQDYLDNP